LFINYQLCQFNTKSFENDYNVILLIDFLSNVLTMQLTLVPKKSVVNFNPYLKRK